MATRADVKPKEGKRLDQKKNTIWLQQLCGVLRLGQYEERLKRLNGIYAS